MIEYNLKKDLKKAEEFANKYPEVVRGYLAYVKKCEDEREEE